MHAAQALLSCGLCWWVLPIRGSLRTRESRFILKIFTDLTRLLTQECRKKVDHDGMFGFSPFRSPSRFQRLFDAHFWV